MTPTIDRQALETDSWTVWVVRVGQRVAYGGESREAAEEFAAKTPNGKVFRRRCVEEDATPEWVKITNNSHPYEAWVLFECRDVAGIVNSYRAGEVSWSGGGKDGHCATIEEAKEQAMRAYRGSWT